jgi:hypothetical protein
MFDLAYARQDKIKEVVDSLPVFLNLPLMSYLTYMVREYDVFIRRLSFEQALSLSFSHSHSYNCMKAFFQQ